jgi:hypothetical protein
MLLIRAKPIPAGLLLVLFLALFATTAAFSSAANPQPARSLPAAPGGAALDSAATGGKAAPGAWVICSGPGKHITRLLATDEHLWIGTEDSGIWQLNLSKAPQDQSAWKQFNATEIGGDVYALAVDQQGRLWAGTAYSGVSVYNGSKWQRYGPIEGCEGERVFDIAADTNSGRPNVWIAHDHGISLYGKLRDGSTGWKTYTQADGLPAGSIGALALRADGCLVAVGECGDLVFSIPPYDKWQSLGNIGLVNRLLFVNDTLVASTTQGLKFGKVGANAWKPWSGLSKKAFENYVTGMATDGAGLWLATRHNGPVYLDPQTSKAELPDDERTREYAVDVAVARGDVWCSLYGVGLAQSKGASRQKTIPVTDPEQPKAEPALPEKARSPTMDEIGAMLPRLAKKGDAGRRVARVEDDWKTRGDWIERYGWGGAIFCAMSGAGGDFRTSHGGSIWYYNPWIGNSGKDDGLRYWVHDLTTNNPKCLQNLILGGRRQADWDDHGEVYPWDMKGPDVYCTMVFPEGDYLLSLYFFNKDGQWDNNRCRDFVLTLKETPGINVDGLVGRSIVSEGYFKTRPALATARVRDFWNPVYKRFYIKGPGTYTFKIERNGSFNTIISGVLVDPVSMPYQVKFLAKVAQKELAPAALAPTAALHQKLLQMQVSDGCWSATSSRPYWIALARRIIEDAGGKAFTDQQRIELADCFDALGDFSRRDELCDRKSFQYKRWLGLGDGTRKQPSNP